MLDRENGDRRNYKVSSRYGPEGPRRGQYGPERGPQKEGPGDFEGPEGPQGSMGPFDGPGFMGPEGPCMSKRCNPFRSRKPSYKSYLKQMNRRHREGPFPGSYGIPMEHGPKYPTYTEIIIIRKVPIMMSKMLVIAAANADKYKPGKKVNF